MLRKAADELGQVLQKVGAAAYAQPGGPAAGGPTDAGGPSQPGGGPASGGTSGPGGDNVVDGEFHSAG